ncbi:MAG: hypothetical protein GX496_12030 [Firmicutes bacterium]|nr:hypothetical protein [Bacillota bacterium]
MGRWLPDVEALASDPMTVDPGAAFFAPPALTNQWASVAADRDLFSYRGLASPPVYSDGVQARLYLGLDGGSLEAAGEAVKPVTYRWYPSRIERRGTAHGLGMETTLALSVAGPAVMEELRVVNTSGKTRQVRLVLLLRADVRLQWEMPWPPPQRSGRVALDEDQGCVEIRQPDGLACVRAGASERPSGWAAFAVDDPRWDEARRRGGLDGLGEAPQEAASVALQYDVTLRPGQSWTLRWVHAVAAWPEQARWLWSQHLRRFDEYLSRSMAAWRAEWEAAFTPGNDRFSGHLPVLRTDHEGVHRLYYMGVLNVLYSKRALRWGERALLYATGLPSSDETFAITSSFLWDAMMVSGLLAMLDPEALRAMMEQWLPADIHRGYGCDYLTGRPLGFWYGVNDFALIHMAWQYVRYTGDVGWLRQRLAGRQVIEHLDESARYWRRIAGEDGLADYGGPENLLECVSTYTHKVASFNAANVWNSRTVAALWELLGEPGRARELREAADRLAQAVQSLYVAGEGVWACKQPDGRLVPVRHCLDFFTVLQCMGDDLRPEQREEMVRFFLRELKTETWMRALSPLDPDAASSDRPDHQHNGAYCTWPAYSLEVLVQTGHFEQALAWLEGIARVTRQGPFGQAYFHGDGDSPRLLGAGAKAPIEPPAIEKPVLIAGGKYAQLVLETLAGISPQPDGTVRVQTPELPLRLAFYNVPLHRRSFHFEWVPGPRGGSACG